jgi:hypothetical protein
VDAGLVERGEGVVDEGEAEPVADGLGDAGAGEAELRQVDQVGVAVGGGGSEKPPSLGGA